MVYLELAVGHTAHQLGNDVETIALYGPHTIGHHHHERHA